MVNGQISKASNKCVRPPPPPLSSSKRGKTACMYMYYYKKNRDSCRRTVNKLKLAKSTTNRPQQKTHHQINGGDKRKKRGKKSKRTIKSWMYECILYIYVLPALPGAWVPASCRHPCGALITNKKYLCHYVAQWVVLHNQPNRRRAVFGRVLSITLGAGHPKS